MRSGVAVFLCAGVFFCGAGQVLAQAEAAATSPSQALEAAAAPKAPAPAVVKPIPAPEAEAKSVPTTETSPAAKIEKGAEPSAVAAVPARAPAPEAESCPDVPSAQPPTAPVDMAALEKDALAGVVGSALTLADEYARLKNFKDAEKWYRFVLYKGDGQGALRLYELHQAGSIALVDAENVRQYGLSLIEEDAVKGNGGSAITMAFLYLQGRFFPKDYDKARQWFSMAEAAGKPMASYQLGLLHTSGLYHDIAPRRAFRYFEAAAAAGIAPATRQVAIAYHTGIGAARDLDKAIVCYTRSAGQGDMLAMRDLGNIYRKDRPNAALSESWFKKAAALGDPDSSYMLGMLYQNSSPGESKRYLDAAVKLKHHLARVKADPSYVPAPESDTKGHAP